MITVILISIIICYLVAIGSLTWGFDRVTTFTLQDLKAKTQFSVVIPFRNEAENLPQLLDSIYKLNYPKNLFEIILVNDDSEDNSEAIISTFISELKSNQGSINIKIIQNTRKSNSPKKDAITSAIAVAKHGWIITTDADCILPKFWLDSFDECIQIEEPNCIVGTVAYFRLNSFFKRFQALDFMSLQGATIGGFGIKQPFLCNGANFGYRKSLFKSLNGFKGNTNIASGDDIFLLEQFKKEELKKVVYLKSEHAIVTTSAVSNFNQLIQQRLRWASKTSHNPNGFSKLLGLIVFLANATCIALIPLLIFNQVSTRTSFALIVIKFGIDFLLLFKTARYLKHESNLLSFLLTSLLYPFFATYIATLSLFSTYKWKGRAFRK